MTGSPKVGSPQAREMLQVDHITAGFGATTVLHGLAYAVRQGEIVGIFGLNGAGKSVSMKVLAGIVPAWSGQVILEGRDITRASAEERVELGIGHVPQGRQVFKALTVEQNLRLGAYTLRRRDRSRYAGVLDGVYDRFPILAERRTQLAGTMSGGQQASLAVARALMSEPKLLCIDEPSAGLAPLVVQELLETLRAVAATGMTMVLVEQNVAFGLQLADTVNILQTGRIVHSGPAADVDSATLAQYLGVGRLLTKGAAGAVATRSTKPAKKATAKRATPKPAARRAAATSTGAGDE
ncbi:MAG TPA: ABC transporter ATP-binding protein [Mycobacteriales bacterium]|nr:ABC transporter ATP-binding protein [Mycobacteriales bacterium]